MNRSKNLYRLAPLALTLTLAASLTPSAMAGGTVSKGHGIKCAWVPVAVVGNTTILNFVCRAKGA